MRRFSEPIQVRTATPVSPGHPEAFIWRDRLYVVREILDHWRERRPWWRDALDAGPRQPSGSTAASAARERQVWRVAASPGRVFGEGVYDLALGDDWRLVGVAD